MKTDPKKWRELKANVQNEIPQGEVQLMFTGEASVFLHQEGVESYAGTGLRVKTRNSGETPATLTFSAAKGVRGFVYWPVVDPIDVDTIGEEIFTSVDSMPHSSAYDVVTHALRLQEMRHRAILNEALMAQRVRAAQEQSAGGQDDPPAGDPPAATE